MRKVNLTRSQLLRLLKDNGFEKKATAQQLGVDEASVRRACERLQIDTDTERASVLAASQATCYPTETRHGKHVCQSHTFVAIPDTHAHTIIWSYLALVCQFMKDFKPQYCIHLGDLMDYECLMGIQKKRYPSFDGQDIGKLEREFQASAKTISMINTSLPKDCKKVFLSGNHEHRVTELLAKAPEFANTFTLEKRIDMHGWEILPFLEKFKLAKLNFIHGEFYGKYPVSKHLDCYQKNVLFGHTHAIAQETKPSPMREIPIWGAMCGCLCTLNADYMRNKSSRAEHGFAYGWFDQKTGDFDCRIVRIIRGNFWTESKRYRV